MPRSAVWSGDPERLDRVLAQLGLARSRSSAAEMIANGAVRVNGTAATKAGLRVVGGSRIETSETDHYVSRAAHKLVAGLDRFGIDARDRAALDVGASTGGFTQVLLERGARSVVAVDVGHDQLASELREDPRVHLVEGCNARYMTAESLAEQTGVHELPSLVVADLSFISLGLVLGAMRDAAAGDADFVLLIKPQFEVGRVSDGVVTDPSLRADAIRTVLGYAAEQGLCALGLDISPISGGEGNIEYLVHLVRGSQADAREWEGRISELCGTRDVRAQVQTSVPSAADRKDLRSDRATDTAIETEGHDRRAV